MIKQYYILMIVCYIYSIGIFVFLNNQVIVMIMIDVYGKVEVFVDGGFENSIVYVSYICNFIGK